MTTSVRTSSVLPSGQNVRKCEPCTTNTWNALLNCAPYGIPLLACDISLYRGSVNRLANASSLTVPSSSILCDLLILITLVVFILTLVVFIFYKLYLLLNSNIVYRKVEAECLGTTAQIFSILLCLGCLKVFLRNSWM